MLIESGCGCAACSAPGSATGSTVAWVLCARARPADTTLGSPARNYTQCRAIPALPQARQGLAAVDIGNMTNVTFMDGDHHAATTAAPYFLLASCALTHFSCGGPPPCVPLRG